MTVRSVGRSVGRPTVLCSTSYSCHGAATTASVRKSIESANTDTLAIAVAASAAANTAKMKEAASKSQHNLMVRRNTELHDMDQLCRAAEDRIIELKELGTNMLYRQRL